MTPREISLLARQMAGVNEARPPQSALFARMNQRQMELFRVAASIDSEYFGACGTVDIPPTGDIAVRLAFDEGVIGQVDVVRVKDAGDYTPNTSTPKDAEDYEKRVLVGDEVTICSAYDAEAHLPPRATLRNGVLQPVGDDFGEANARLKTLEVFYQRMPRAIVNDATGEKTKVDLEPPWDMLLVYDAVRFIASMESDAKGATEMLVAQEDDLFAQFKFHVEHWSGSARPNRFEAGA